MILDSQLREQAQFAADWLRGESVFREISKEDVAYWREAQVLLPIGDTIEQRLGGLQSLPACAAAQLRAERHAAAVIEAGERRVMAEVLSHLRSVGVPSLLLKGAALSYTVYRVPWLRARADIDLLVPAGTLEKVTDALARIRFDAAREVTHPLVTRQRHFTRQGAFQVAIDVHDALVNPPVLRALPAFDVLYARAQRVSPIGDEAYALCTPDALLHALVHRVAHHNSSVDLLWLYDMHLLVSRMQDADWGTFADSCERSRVSRIALDGLQLLIGVFQTRVPTTVIDALAGASAEPSAALLGGHLTEWRLQWINFKSLHGVRQRVEFVRAHLAPPAGELAFVPRNKWRQPFGYVHRLVNGARKWWQPISRAR